MQIQAELGEGHEGVIKAYEAILTPTHLCLVMEYAAGGSLTAYVADKWQKAQALGLFLSEDEARYFFKVIIFLLTGLNCAKMRGGWGGGAPTAAGDALCCRGQRSGAACGSLHLSSASSPIKPNQS